MIARGPLVDERRIDIEPQNLRRNLDTHTTTPAQVGTPPKNVDPVIDNVCRTRSRKTGSSRPHHVTRHLRAAKSTVVRSPPPCGAQLTLPERRALVLVGDGSALLTLQEIGSMLRAGTRPIIVVLNNNGYTVERAIHGPEERYNDVPAWYCRKVTSTMGRDTRLRALHAATPGALKRALQQAADADCRALIEAVRPKLDIPPLLSAIAQSLSRENQSVDCEAREMSEESA